jgi:hypothetical protein
MTTVDPSSGQLASLGIAYAPQIASAANRNGLDPALLGRNVDPAQNANYAARLLSGLLRRNGGNVREALYAYNAGDPHATGTLTRWSDGSTLGYADSAMRRYDGLTGSSPLDSARDEQNETASSVNVLLSAALSQPASFTIPTVPQHDSWQSTQGLDATGHRRDGDATSSDSSDEGDS